MKNLIKQAARPIEENFGSLLGGRRQTRVNPTETIGSPATAIYGGYVVENEQEAALSDREKYRTFANALANTAIVSAGVRYTLNLIADAEWSFVPAADHPQGQEFADRAKKMITEDPKTPWPRIVRRTAMFRYYGFSIQEWTARRDDDGALTFDDIAPRGQQSIERWDVNTDGSVNGVVQRNPQNQLENYLPRGKIVYAVDDSLNDSPQGLGLFRHIVEPVRRLNRYEQLEGFGFETDLRGVPIGRAPYAELNARVQAGEITAEEARRAVAPLETFIKKHIKRPDLGLLLDSQVFQTTDDAQRPSSQQKFGIDLLDGSQNSLPEIAQAIMRVNREIARIMGVEAILLGDNSSGSLALARDKSSQLSLIINATLRELAETYQRDLLDTLWVLNGWPDDAKPKMSVESVEYRTVEEISAAIRDLANAGALIEPDDPIINFVRGLIGAPLLEQMSGDIDAALGGSPNGNNAMGEGETMEEETT